MPSRLVGSRYALGEPVGRGGMGTVWRGEDLALQRPVAVKEVFEAAGANERLLREGRAAARLNHPGAVTVFDVFEEDGRAYLVMELVDASNLSEVVAHEGPLAVSRVAELGVALADALAAAHAQGIVHRDVKPANVLVRPDGSVKLGDFGIAAGADLSAITMTGLVLGSPNYMSPEQAHGVRDAVGPATDLWSLGATLYLAVEGVPPFGAGRAESIAILHAVVSEPPRPPVLAGPLEPVLLALLAKDPADRPSLASVRAALADIAAGRVSAAFSQPNSPAAPAPAPAPAPVAFVAPPAAPETATGAKKGGRGRSRLPIAVAAVAIAALCLAAAVVATRGSGHPSSSTSAPPTSAPAPAVPAGWVPYRDTATGYTISFPPGWQVVRNGSLTDFRDPSSPTYLRVDWTATPGPSAEAAWRSLAASFGATHAGYTEFGITPTSYKGMPAAAWEYAYDERGPRLHAVDLGMVAGRYGFALNFQTTDAAWASDQPLFRSFEAAFNPPK